MCHTYLVRVGTLLTLNVLIFNIFTKSSDLQQSFPAKPFLISKQSGRFSENCLLNLVLVCPILTQWWNKKNDFTSPLTEHIIQICKILQPFVICNSVDAPSAAGSNSLKACKENVGWGAFCIRLVLHFISDHVFSWEDIDPILRRALSCLPPALSG